MRKTQKKYALLGCILGLICCFGIFGVNVLTASAGSERKQPTVDNFDDGKISDYWITENTDIALDVGAEPALKFSDASEGAGLITLDTVSASSVEIELEIQSLDFSAGGWLCFMLGTKSASPILNWTEFLGSGKYLTLSYHSAFGWLLRTYTTDASGAYKVYNFVDVNGKDISLATYLGNSASSGDETYYMSALPKNNGKLEDITLSICLDETGDFSISYRDKGAENSAEQLVLQTQNVSYEPYTEGYLGFCVMQGSKGISGKVSDLRTYVNGNTTAATAFRKDQDNIGSEYLMDLGGTENGIAFVCEGKLQLQTSQNEAYAIHKTSATFDKNVVDSVVGKNITVKQTVYLDTLSDDAEFCLNFGLTKASYIQLKEEGSYAVCITRAAEKTYFSLIQYTSDDGTYTALLDTTEFTAGNGFDICLIIDGNGNASLQVADKTATIADMTFLKNKVFFANILTGTASVRIDDFSMNNIIYSTPSNKDLFADFTNNDININEWYLPDWGGNLEERYDGVYAKNEELVFNNVNSNAGITTIPQYSNFELKFDITDIQRAEVDDGIPSTDIRVMYGIQGYKDSFNMLYTAYNRPLFSLSPYSNGKETRYSILNIENERAGTLPEKYNIFAPSSEGKIFNILFSTTDGLVEARIKLSTEETYYTIFSIQTSSSITGHIRISGYGDGLYGDGACSNFSIDNLSVKNTDKDANNTMDYGYKSNSDWIKWDGYEYEDTWKDDELLPIYQETAESTGCGSSITLTAGGGVLLFLSGLLQIFKKEKRGHKNEK